MLPDDQVDKPLESRAPIRPYQSYLIAEYSEQDPEADPACAILNAVRPIVLASRRSHREAVLDDAGHGPDGTRWAYFIYKDESKPTWLLGDHPARQIVDIYHGLVVVVFRAGFVAIHTPPDKREQIRSVFGKDLDMLRAVPQERLNRAFVNGPTRRIWLSGAHGSTALKPDTKYMGGIDLRQAIDPMIDRTYHFTAARSTPTLEGSEIGIGVTPRKSSVWIKDSLDWDEFINVSRLILGTVASATEGTSAPFPFLASPCEPDDLAKPYEMCLLPSGMLSGDPLDVEQQQQMERAAYGFRFEVHEGDGPDVEATLFADGESIAELQLSPVLHSGRVRKFDLYTKSLVSGKDDDLELLSSIVEDDPESVRIWYGSGHTLSNGQFYRAGHTTYPFLNFIWADFTGYLITREKPRDKRPIGTDQSLFCWVVNNWPGSSPAEAAGWLACDDGSHEVADFIHWDAGTSPPTLTLIHVKAAGNDSPNRRAAVSMFEVVAAQALKNLRYLDTLLLSGGLANGLNQQVAAHAWHCRSQCTLDEFQTAVEAAGTNCRRQVIIVQPHLKETIWQSSGQSDSKSRLNDLLYGTMSQALSKGAEFRVVGSK